MGKRTQYRNNRLYIEQDDAKELLEGQKLTIYKWGNSLVTKIEKENDKIIRVHANLTPEDLNFKGTKVAHWVLKKEEFVIKNLIIKLN
jgi:hypothetical protein